MISPRAALALNRWFFEDPTARIVWAVLARGETQRPVAAI
jgi:hypothetical protein